MTDRTWLPRADGKAVQIAAQLLPYLPPKPHRFSVIFMERDLDEVTSSQEVMLANLEKPGARLPRDKLKPAYVNQIAGLERLLSQHSGVSVPWVNHADLLAEPVKTARRVELFLGRDLDKSAMTAVVDPRLHRQRRPCLDAVG